MREHIEATGRTEEEAIRRALEQLGLERDEVSVEVLERPKAGFLGIGRTDARVRVSYGEDEIPAPPPDEQKNEPKEELPERRREKRRHNNLDSQERSGGT